MDTQALNRTRWDLISDLRFPLAVMVVCIHCGNRPFTDGSEWFRVLFAQIIPTIAVPLFFLISGYLFYVGLEEWNWSVWKEKMRRRVRTLLVPYLLWLTLFVVYTYLHKCRLSVTTGNGWIDPITWLAENGGVKMWWDSCTDKQMHPLGYSIVSTKPFYGELWFLRDLMIADLLSPFLFFCIKRAGYYSIVALGVFFLLHLKLPIPYIGITCLFFFSVGGLISIKRKSLEETFSALRWPCWILSAVSIVPLLLFRENEYYIVMKQFWIIVWGVSAVNLVALLPYKGAKTRKALAESTFFIYVTHAVVLANIRHALQVQNIIALNDMAVFVLTVALTIPFCFLAYRLLRHYAPRSYRLLCGKITI